VFGDLVAALFASPPLIVIPKIEHCLTEMLNDIGTIKIDVFDQRSAIVAVENDVFMLARRAATLHHYAERVRWAHWRVWNIWRDEECLPFPHKMIDDPVAFADAHFDIAFQLVEILFRINQMKIVSRVWPFNDHHEKVAPVVKILIAYRWLKFFPVLLDPVMQINRRLHGGRGAFLKR